MFGAFLALLILDQAHYMITGVQDSPETVAVFVKIGELYQTMIWYLLLPMFVFRMVKKLIAKQATASAVSQPALDLSVDNSG